MIKTQQQKIPMSWLILLAMPQFFSWWIGGICGAPLVYSLTRMGIKAPTLFTAIGSMPDYMTILFIGPFIAWKSDRIWTRMGRRKPFILGGLTGMTLGAFLIPFAPNLYFLIPAIMLLAIGGSMSWNGAMPPLGTELVPQPQRGRSTAFGIFFGNLGGGLFFNYVIVKNVAEKKMFGLDWLSGEEMAYWIVAIGFLITAIYYLFMIRETPMPPAPGPDKFSVFPFIKSLFGEYQYRMIFLLSFAGVALNSGLAQLGTKIMTDQFGYDFKFIGTYQTALMMVRMFVILPIIGFLADRFNRRKLFVTSAILTVFHPVIWWSYLHFVNGMPKLPELLICDIFGGFVHMQNNVIVGPLMFDYVSRKKMGTFCAGSAWVRSLSLVIINNGLGIFVQSFNHYLPREGGKIDYSCGLLYNCGFYILGVIAMVLFMNASHKNRVLPLGVMEHQEHAKAEAEAKSLAEQGRELVTEA